MLNVENLSIFVSDNCLLDNISFNINPGEIHVFMGKNGIGKSSLAKAIMGDNNYKVKGIIKYNNKELTKLNIYDRAKEGIYLVNQSPISIEGVTNAEMLRMALFEKTKKNVNIFDFNKELESICKLLELDKKFIHSEINVGASGGERKKIELLHMWILKPSFIILDEIDSGLDVDALKVVANSIKKYYKEYKPAIMIITHNSNFISNFDNYYVHLINDKKIVKSGDKSLAKEILTKGYKELTSENVISEK